MIERFVRLLPHCMRRSLAVAALASGAVALVPSPHAQARVFFSFGFPFYYPAPFYYPPPAYYPYYAPPPPVVYAPPQSSYSIVPPASHAQSCDAGAYICPMETPVAPGSTCWCPNNAGGRSYGRAS
jgi:hypothetical protein